MFGSVGRKAVASSLLRGAAGRKTSARAALLVRSVSTTGPLFDAAPAKKVTPITAAAPATDTTHGEAGTAESLPASASIVNKYPVPAADEVPVDVTFGDVSTAAYRIRSGVGRTLMHRSRKFSQILNASIYFKNEFQHPTGSFKERGGRNALMQLSPEAKKRGVIAASAGNHALALAYHGQELGIPVTVVMPKIAPITKVQNCRELNADVRVEGAHIGEAKEIAMKIGEQSGLTYINGYDHPSVIAGAGTLGVEILEQCPDVEAVVIPCGGAGLVAGTALAIKTLRPDVKIIAAEPDNVPSLTAALEAGKPVTVQGNSTLADGLLVPRVGTNAFALCHKYVDKTVRVHEKFIALAMLRLVEIEKSIVEGGGAAGLAAMLQGLLPELEGKKVCIPLCGGNVDTPVLGRVLERGLAADGRLVRFTTAVSDRPGGIAALTTLLAKFGASIKDIYHNRASPDTDISSVRVTVVVETADMEHAQKVIDSLEEKGYEIEMQRLRPIAKTGPSSGSGKGKVADPGSSAYVE